jgi:hypothetical protein
VLPLAVCPPTGPALTRPRRRVAGPDDAPEALLPWLAGIPLVAIHFPVFTDGRAIPWPICCAAATATPASCGRWVMCWWTSSP